MEAMAEPEKMLRELERLACPVCHATLRVDTNMIVCTGCARRYPVLDGIPVLLAGRAS
jgi:uncharacterized protein YbaR (Trm112 family)